VTSRRRRAVWLIAAAITAVVVTSLLYLRSEVRPVAVTTTPAPTPVSRLVGDYTPAFDFVDPNHGWAIVVDYGPQHRCWIFSTNDRAAHWHLQTARTAAGGYAYIRFFDLRHGFAYAGSLYRTADGGATWIDVQLPADTPYFAFANASSGWMLADQLYATTDGGTTWTAVDSPLPAGVTVDPSGAGELAFRTDGEGWLGAMLPDPVVYVTRDAARTWQAISLPSSQPGFESYTTQVRLAPDGGVLALVASPGGFLGGYYSDDLGATWRLVDAPLPQPEWLADVSFLDAAHWWVARYGFLYKTSDAGVSWTRVLVDALPEGWNVGPVHVIDVDHGWWTMIATDDSRDNALMTTSDGGASWRAVNMPRPA
jgi:photosystem II stability/assembly factor-like uncharacterized protein